MIILDFPSLQATAQVALWPVLIYVIVVSFLYEKW